jgi:hypothetical protein
MAPPASADVLYSNLDPNASLGGGFEPFAGDTYYSSFSTGASWARLTEVQLVLSGGYTGTGTSTLPVANGSGTVSVSLYADSLLSPTGSPLLLGSQTVTDTSNPVDLTLSSTILLGSDTRYWIGVTSSSSTLSWDWSWDYSGYGVAGEYSYSDNFAWDNPDNGSFEMQVDVQTVPEPASLMLLACGLLGLAISRRSRAA